MMTTEKEYDLPASLSGDPNFQRYWAAWKENAQSIAFVPLAELLRESGQPEQAERVCREGLGFHPESVAGRVVLAKVCKVLGRIDECRELLHDVLVRAPDNKEARILLEKEFPGKSLAKPWETVTMAQVCANQGDLVTAMRICRVVLAREPSHSGAQNLMTRLKGERQE